MKTIQIVLMGVALTYLCGCASVKVDKPSTCYSPHFSVQVQAFCANEYAPVESLLSPEMCEQMSEMRFHEAFESLTRYGTVSHLSYLDTLQQGVTFSELWKITLEKTNRQGETEKTEKMLRLIGGTVDNQPHIIGMMLQ